MRDERERTRRSAGAAARRESLTRDARLRAAPGFRLVPLNQLTAIELARLGRFEAGGQWAGVLMPREPGWRRLHLVTTETARLLQALHQPGSLRSSRCPLSARDALRLVLDGILEVEHAGRMWSGPASHSLFFSAKQALFGNGRNAALSLDALHYAASLGSTDPLLLAERLYRYNTKPLSPDWRRRFPKPSDAARLLDADRHGKAARVNRGRDAMLESPGGRGVWRVWENEGARFPMPQAATFKLYLSPDLPAIGEAVRLVLELFDRKGAPFSAKVGRDLPNLLRPDKLVAYFARRSDLLESASRLRRALDGIPAQGVPFTAPLDAEGLISWATDPPDDAEPPGPYRRRSWRGWVTTRLAAALASALGAGVTVTPWRYAIDRVSLDGVDPGQWIRPDWRDGVDADH